MKTCCVIGLGYIGLPTAAVLAKNGFKVIGVDINKDIVKKINNAEIHINETGLSELVKEVVNQGSLEARETPTNADIFIITVPTPLRDNNNNIPCPDISYVKQAVSSIIELINEGNLIILESTSPVGTTDEIAELIISKTNLSLDKFHIAYCPERVIPGKTLEELISNSRIVGGVNISSALEAKKLYESFCKGEIYITNSKTAEITKLSENTYRDINIAFANELSIISESLNIDVGEIIELANKHPRVNILQPGCGVGGHCIAVDPWFIASQSPNESDLIQTARKVNLNKPKWIIEKIKEKIDFYQTKQNRVLNIGCFGLAYKPDTEDIRESPALEIVKDLIKSGYKVLTTEPNLDNHLDIELFETEEVLNKSDIYIFLVSHHEFKNLEINKDKIILDFCGLNQKK